MIVSRIVPLALRSSTVLKNGIGGQQKRLLSTSNARQGGHGDWSYRSFTPAARKYEIWADCAGAFMWWWIFWHVFTDYEHITGHYTFPDYADWTDEELGIPTDDVD